MFFNFHQISDIFNPGRERRNNFRVTAGEISIPPKDTGHSKRLLVWEKLFKLRHKYTAPSKRVVLHGFMGTVLLRSFEKLVHLLHMLKFC